MSSDRRDLHHDRRRRRSVISARLSLQIEDIADGRTRRISSRILRENLSSDSELTNLTTKLSTATGQAPNLVGIFMRLTDPTAAPSAVSDFDAFAAAHADAASTELWSEHAQGRGNRRRAGHLWRCRARSFQTATSYKGEMSAAAYAAKETGGWWTNKRLPDRRQHS